MEQVTGTNFATLQSKLLDIAAGVTDMDITALKGTIRTECAEIFKEMDLSVVRRLAAIAKLSSDERESIRNSQEWNTYQVGLHNVKNDVAKFTSFTGVV